MLKLEDANAKTRNQSDRDSPKARIYESFTSPNYIFQNNMCNFAVKTRIINMSIIMKRNGKERNIWMQQLLNLPPRLVPFNTLIIGYPKEMIKPKDKWKEENVTRI